MSRRDSANAERVVQEQMLATLEWAAGASEKMATTSAKLEATQRAAELLKKRGVIEIWPETNQYRLKPQK